MEKKEAGNKYELVVIVESKLTGDEKESIYKEVTETIIKGGGKIINSHVWLERQRLTFPIKRQHEGTYYLINFEAPGPLAKKMDPVLRLNERLLRYLITHVESHTTLAAGKGTTHHS